MIRLGKMTAESKTLFKPSAFLWGGCIFINWLRVSVMIVLPDAIKQELLIWGFNVYGD